MIFIPWRGCIIIRRSVWVVKLGILICRDTKKYALTWTGPCDPRASQNNKKIVLFCRIST